MMPATRSNTPTSCPADTRARSRTALSSTTAAWLVLTKMGNAKCGSVAFRLCQ